MVKEKLSLLNNSINIFDFPQSTIDTLLVDESDKEIFLSSLKIYMKRMKNDFTYPYIKFHTDSEFKYIDIIRLSKYPLPAVFNKKTNRVIINLPALQKRSVSNIAQKDLYTIVAYAHTCLVFSMMNSKISRKYFEPVCEYMGFVFLKLFAKKYGITGSYVDKIPQFRFIVFSYIYQEFFGLNQKTAIRSAANLSHYDHNNMDVDIKKYDMSDFNQFLKLLSDSEVTPGLNQYRFLDQIIKSFGTMNLPFFEDFMRFSCIMVSSSITGNSYFSAAFQMFSSGYYAKVLDIIEDIINKEM